MVLEFVIIISIILNITLAAFVLLKNYKSHIHTSFALFVFSIAAWTLINYASNVVVDYRFAFNLNKLIFLITPYIGFSLLYFCLVFPRRYTKLKMRYLVLIFLPVLISNILTLLNLTITDIKFLSEGGTGVMFGSGIYLFAVIMLFYITLSVTHLGRKYWKATGIEKAQIQYLLFGVGITTFIGIITNLLIPILFNNFWISNFGPLSSFALAGFTAYAILKHRLMDIRFVVARTVAYVFLTISIVVFYSASLFAIGHWIFPTKINSTQQYVSIALTIIIALTLQPLRAFWEKTTDNIFFKDKYDPQEVLSHISKMLSSSLQVTQLVEGVFKFLLPILHIESGQLLLFKNGTRERVLGNVSNKERMLTNLHTIYAKITSLRQSMFVFDDLSEGRIKEVMRELSLSVIIQLRVKNEAIGLLLLGNKQSGDMLTTTDINLLRILSPQLAIAVQNARQYEEIQQFSEELKLKVEQATTKLKDANSKLKDLDRRKDEFISVAAHDLRAPLTAVKGYLSMILEGDAGKVSHKMEEFLQGAFDGAEREIRLVNNMLNVSRIEENRLVFQMGNVHLIPVIKQICGEFEESAKAKRLRLGLSVEPKTYDTVYVDEDRIHEVVANLISNAIKYTDKGEIHVYVCNSEDGRIQVSIRDSGRGMMDEECTKLFTKFYRAESSAGTVLGTGLGLYITKLLVEKFGGTIKVDSRLGKGSTFTVELPVKH